ncbi:hypothetical protein [Flavihumibacter petaseus]|uniref:Uncharacterized protein n=1 Tax=Flavihumibacter petaseus NBRC 106054 TaxID=1220578 RepID=A0A0E9N602_9BACT|nr:hypothetical protein [Flavihumibacter petaseus]GAO45233.1 hypothetical protein FPE01S_04_04770 [Flavihumibacter petaseus NBRC 106054]
MKYLSLLLLFFSAAASAQNADWKELQGLIDKAVNTNGKVFVARNYKIDRPLVVANKQGESFNSYAVTIHGDATMWDVNSRSVIQTTYTDAPAMIVQSGKSVILEGLNFQGRYIPPKLTVPELYGASLQEYQTRDCRDNPETPYAAIAVDPFCCGGISSDEYPGLGSWYINKSACKGTTGKLIIKDCTFNGFIVGLKQFSASCTITKSELRLENIRIGTCKVGIAFGGSATGSTTIENIGAWGLTHTLFDFDHYGIADAGTCEINGINIAGDVVQMINKARPGSKIVIRNVFAESLGRIGIWISEGNDRLDNASINFRYINQVQYHPDYVLWGDNVTISLSTLRYYGQVTPMVFLGNQQHVRVSYQKSRPLFVNDAKKERKWKNDLPVTVTDTYRPLTINGNAKTGDYVFFFDKKNRYLGFGDVRENSNGKSRIEYLSSPAKYKNELTLKY